MTHRATTSLMFAALFGLLAGCASQSGSSASMPDIRTGPTVEARNGMVVSVCPIASDVGAKVLRDGGNAVDAAVATAFALAVTWPEAGNIGGGGFMMIAEPGGHGPLGAPATSPAVADGDDKRSASSTPAGGDARAPRVSFIDYRETAPAAVKADTFANKTSSHLLAGTPGTVRGLWMAWQSHGSRRIAWEDLVIPSVKLAADGFTVDKALAASLNSGLRNAEAYPEFRRVYGKPDGSAWKAGDRLVLPELAATLRLIADRGPDGFYEGPTAEKIVREMQAGGGLISAADLTGYTAKRREPLRAELGGHTIYAPPPPSSGGVALFQMLNMLERFAIKPADRWSPQTSHIIVEVMRRAFADRARYLGDPDFGVVPVEKLISKPHAFAAEGIAINPDRASTSDEVAPWRLQPREGDNTTHFSVIDGNGVAVSNTYTLEQSFGGKVVVRGAGFLLNNELGDFNPVPGDTNTAGRIGTPPNLAAGGKRPLSSMTPVIVMKDGKVFLVTGSPGGRTIINTVTQVVINRLMFGMSLREAVDAPRLHHQWFPDAIRVEKKFAEQHPKVIEALKAMGHKIDANMPARQGDAHSIEVKPDGTIIGVADTRIGGAAAGY